MTHISFSAIFLVNKKDHAPSRLSKHFIGVNFSKKLFKTINLFFIIIPNDKTKRNIIKLTVHNELFYIPQQLLNIFKKYTYMFFHHRIIKVHSRRGKDRIFSSNMISKLLIYFYGFFYKTIDLIPAG